MTQNESVGPRIIHGVLVAVYGLGILIRGESGAGKSELALELIRRGHQLVADDAVTLFRRKDELFGEAPPLTSGILAISGLGMVNVAVVFGPAAVASETMVSLCIDLVIDDQDKAFDLLQDTWPTVDLFGIPVPTVRLDVSRRPVNATVIETAARILDQDSALAGAGLAAEHDRSVIRLSSIP